MLTGARVLVTGAAGRVGFPIARALAANGNTVFGLARFRDPADIDKVAAAGIHPVVGDLHGGRFDDLPDALTHVFHAGAAFGREAADWSFALEVNALSTGRLMRAVAGTCRGFVYCSTGSTYAYQGRRPLREDDPPGIHTTGNYSFSKVAGEAVVQHVSAEHDVPATIIRIFSTYGPEGGAPWDRVARMLVGDEIVLHPDSPNHYNPIYEDDYVRLGIRALEVASTPPLIVNWGGSETVSAEDYLAYAGSLLDVEPRIVYRPDAWTPLWPDVTRMHQVLGRCEVPWREGFRRMLEAKAPDRLAGRDRSGMTDGVAVPFEVAVPRAALDDLGDRLRRTRFADDFGNDDWTFGVPREYLHGIVDYWIERFDWRVQEGAMNRFAQFRVVLDEVPIHFVHERGRGPAPMPLILTHGWPWTFWDYEQVIAPLVDPAAFGGDPRDAFDVVVPSLPGTAFSSPLRTTGIGVTATADLWLRLMQDVLGYDHFVAGGGDSGAFVSTWLGHAYGQNLIGVHLSFPATVSMAALGSIRPDDYSTDELQDLVGASPQDRGTSAHMAVHIEDPQTLAWAMNDSPAGLAAWLIERRRNWSDCGGDVESRFTKDQLLTTVALYWLTGTFHTSVRFYAESFRAGWPLRHDRQPPVEVPTAVAAFPGELLRVPRRFMERQVNLARWTVMPRGGHFAPSEEPELLVEDIRAFFRDLR